DELQSSYTIQRGVTLTGSWLATQKITATTSLSFNQRNLVGSASFFGLSQDREDSVSTLTFGGIYSFDQHIGLQATASFSDQRSNAPLAGYIDELVSLGAFAKF